VNPAISDEWVDGALAAKVLEYDRIVSGLVADAKDVPIAQLGGVKNSGEGSLGMFCRLFGTTVPIAATDLATRYPNRRAFVSAWNKAVERALKAGYLVPEDAKELKRAAAQSQIGA
jgi:hypothetical protein